jgi:hypothetical protein
MTLRRRELLRMHAVQWYRFDLDDESFTSFQAGGFIPPALFDYINSLDYLVRFVRR